MESGFLRSSPSLPQWSTTTNRRPPLRLLRGVCTPARRSPNSLNRTRTLTFLSRPPLPVLGGRRVCGDEETSLAP
ncbi:hypothetical protein MRX96_048614 [Rhipicephalus microplus]